MGNTWLKDWRGCHVSLWLYSMFMWVLISADGKPFWFVHTQAWFFGKLNINTLEGPGRKESWHPDRKQNSWSSFFLRQSFEQNHIATHWPKLKLFINHLLLQQRRRQQLQQQYQYVTVAIKRNEHDKDNDNDWQWQNHNKSKNKNKTNNSNNCIWVVSVGFNF